MLQLLMAAILLHWHDLPPLPLATSGQFAGVSNGALIVVGGSSFEKPPYDGGTKQWLDTVFVLEPDAKSWLVFHAPHAMAYGGSVTWKDHLIVAGGSDGRANFRDTYRVEWNSGQVAFVPLLPLPVALANCEAALLEDRMYLFGGQQTPTATGASNRLLQLDLAHTEKGWTLLEPLPGPARILPVFSASGGSLFVFGGAELTPHGRRYLTDGWRWNPANGWQPIAAPPFAMVAAPAVAVRQSIFVFGGDDGANASRIDELRDRHPGFSRELYEFLPARQIWSRRAGLPAGLVTTTAVPWRHNVIIPGGEDRPGHRSARVISWNPE
jgi:N-acetylneuraminic acid mutarotase